MTVTENNNTTRNTEYVGKFVYDLSNDTLLDYLVTPEGRMLASNGDIRNSKHEFYLTDHLGNTRAVIQQHPVVLSSSELLQESHYYPFGQEFVGLDATAGSNNYKYNGKELQQDLKLQWYDYGARFYDQQLARFHTLDPLAERYFYQSPFVYAVNNPIGFIDWMGMSASPYYDEQGNFLGVDENGFAGEIYITNQETIDANSTDGVANSETIQADENTESIGTANLSNEALSNVYTDVITNMDKVSSDELYNGQVSIFNGTGSWDYENGGMNYDGHNNPDNFPVFGHSDTEDRKHKITVGPDGHSEITTVENVQNALGVHEFVAHGKKGVPGGATKGHTKAYELQMAHPTWKGTTPQFKKDMIDRYNKYLNY